MPMRRFAIIPGLGVLALAAAPVLAETGRLANRTIMATFDVEIEGCAVAGSPCTRAVQKEDDHLYVMRKGMVLDYSETRRKTGVPYEVGKWRTVQGGRYRAVIEGDTLLMDGNADGFRYQTRYKVSGSTCAVSYTIVSSPAGFRYKTSVRLKSCKVADGRIER